METIPFVSTFGAFFSRTADQLRMGKFITIIVLFYKSIVLNNHSFHLGAISQANIKCVGSHCGVSIGEDGPSQMALEDLSFFRAIPDAVVFYPSDAVSTERAVELAAQFHGIAFIRTSRPATAVIYPNNKKFVVGKSEVVKSHGNC